MSVRGIVTAVAVGMGAMSLLIIVELALMSSWMNHATEQMATHAEGVRAAERIDVTLRSFNRENYLYSRTLEAEHLSLRDKARGDLKQSIAAAKTYVDNGAEAELIRRIERKTDEFERDILLRDDQEPIETFEHYLLGTQAVDAITDDIESLVSVNLQQATDARDEAHKLDQMAQMSALALTIVMLISIAIMLMWVRRALYHPFAEMREVVARYASGELTIRAAENGPDELRLIATQFNNAADKLARQRESQLQFLASIAHDLRNPLMASKLALSVMDRRKDEMSPAQIQLQMAIVKRQTDRLDRMIDDFMDLTLIENGRFELRLERRDLREVARGAVELYRSTSPSHQLVLSLPEKPVLVQCDMLRMEQVLNNLLSNAIKYSPNGGEVRVSCQHRENNAILSVCDHGLGISVEDCAKLFAPFTRVGPTRESIPGIGLGLSAAKRLVEAHGGQIELESTLGVGSTVHVIIPLQPPSAKVLAERVSSSAVPSPQK